MKIAAKWRRFLLIKLFSRSTSINLGVPIFAFSDYNNSIPNNETQPERNPHGTYNHKSREA